MNDSIDKSTNNKPYWVIQAEAEKELDIVINSPVETKYNKDGTISRFRGKIIGYNLSYEDVCTYKRIQECNLRDLRCEIIMYESCLYNLPYDNRYPNIRSIFAEMRRQIAYYKSFKHY